jgi:integrase
MKTRHLVCRELASGKHYYFKPSKAMLKAGFINEPLGTNKAAARARVEALNREWDESRRALETVQPRQARAGTVGDLIDRFQSDKVYYLAKHPRTREEMDRGFKSIRATFEDIPAAMVRRKHCRAFYNQLLESCSVHKAHMVMKWFSRLMNYAIEIEWLEFNPLHRMEIEQPEPRKEVWQPEEVNALIAAALSPAPGIPARPSLALAAAIAYETSLPEQDILALCWPQYDGEGLAVQQKKKRGNRDLWLPLSEDIRRWLDRQRQQAGHVIINEETGDPYRSRVDFGRAFRKLRARAGIQRRLTFHDLRRTALTEMGNRGATNAEITAMSGHSINSPVLKVYVRPDREAAKRAVAKRRTQP